MEAPAQHFLALTLHWQDNHRLINFILPSRSILKGATMSFHEKVTNFISRLAKREDGVTAIEYALIAGAIIVAIYLLVNAIGGSTSTTFSTINSALAR